MKKRARKLCVSFSQNKEKPFEEGILDMKKFLAVFSACILLFSLSACKGKTQTEAPAPPVGEEAQAEIDSRIASMTLEEKIYQLFVVAPEALGDGGAVTEVSDSLREGLAAHPVGGLIFFGDNLKSREQVTSMLEDFQKESKIPLFMAVDEEGGSVSRLGNVEDMGVTAHPSMEEVGKKENGEEAYKIGKTIGTEIKELGFNTNFAPVADLKLSEDNTEIGSRSFGSDPEKVSAMVENMVRGLREGGVASGIKHFPGHGSATTDSHTGRAKSTRTIDEMQGADWLPFRAGINAYADFVMISHMVNKEVTKTDMECSMSTNVMTNYLRKGIGFPNIIITDSLSMGAITKYYSSGAAAITAFEAGADMLLMPENLEEAVAAIRGAVSSGRVTEERINRSLARIFRVKLERGIL